MKGKLLIIGGAESKGNNFNDSDSSSATILSRFIEECRLKKRSRIEIVTTASTVPEEVGPEYIEVFKNLGAKNVGVLPIAHRNEADAPEQLERLKKADAVFFSGGTQLRLTSILGGTQFHNLLHERLQKSHFIYAGTSAGAAAASESMIVDGNSDKAAYKGEVVTTTGLRLLSNIIFDTHFIARGRIGRLFEIVVTNPNVLGVGLDENTALLISNKKMEAVGPGMAIIIDGLTISNSNLLDIHEGAPLSISDLTLHVMSKTDVYDLEKRKLNIITPREERVND
ncbi:cyanophycinase [Kaistella palustris]|uniref:cyanophycinase n=1 Tax=Kaistella palustris TaxID=493376 RepID=UPI0004898C16|nr:cyanophycinase [Kaistella palustris]